MHRRRDFLRTESDAAAFASAACAFAVAFAVALALPSRARAAEPASTESAPVPAVWQQHEVSFTYMGITSLYSCDGLEDKLEHLLREAGARADLKVTARGCEYGPNRISRMPRAKLVFWSLAPADAMPPAPAAAPAAPPAKQMGRDAPKLKKDPPPPERALGVWRRVELRTNTPRWLETGDCELVEQFRREVLPKFTTRDVQGGARCTPHQQSVLDIRLKFDVLGAMPSGDVGRGDKTPSGAAPEAPKP